MNKRINKTCLIIVLLMMCVNASFAGVVYWRGGISGDATEWNDAANWDGDVPAPGDHVVIHNLSMYMPVIDSDAGQVYMLTPSWHEASASVTINDGGKLRVINGLILGNGAGGVGGLHINGGELTVWSLSVGKDGDGEILLNGGKLFVEAQNHVDSFRFGQDIGTGTGHIDIEAGQLIIMDDFTSVIADYVADGRIAAYGGSGRIYYDFHNTTTGSTTVMAVDDLAMSYRPIPGNKRGDVDFDIVLEWSQGDGAVAHDVYFGDDFDDVDDSDISDTTGIYRNRISSNNYTPAILQSEKTYYWRVDEVDGSNQITRGDVWSFTTRSNVAARDLFCDTWVATDDLDRDLPSFEQCGGPRENKTVGIYYNLMAKRMPPLGPHNNTEIIAANPSNPDFRYDEPLFYWAEPEANYYLPDDEWVIRRNLSMLSDAGVDVLILEATNGPTYVYETLVVCEVLQRMIDEGFDTQLKMCVWSYANSPSVITAYYNQIYALNLYPDLWYHWDGKPLMLGYPDGLSTDDPSYQPQTTSQEIRDFFTWRTCWYDVTGSLYREWQWGDLSPQSFGWDDAEYVPEEVPIMPASHPIANIGKSNSGGVQPPNNEYDLPVAGTHGHGIRFAEQWERALELDPEFIFLTEWNEWMHGWLVRTEETGPISMVGKSVPIGGYYAVDLYNMEYTRDIAPMRGGYTDNYYWQMIDGIRRFKGVRPPQTTSDAKTISIDGDFSDWSEVAPEYRDTLGDTFHRDHYGYAKSGPYTNSTGRNDFADLKVARDDNFVYFYAKTREDISAYTDASWMQLFINSDQDSGTGWQGYDYIVNGTINSSTSTVLGSMNSGWGSSSAAAQWNLDEVDGAIANDLIAASNGAVSGATWQSAGGHIDGALEFDGSDDFVVVSDNDDISVGTGDYTIAMWIKPDDVSGVRGLVTKMKDGSDKEFAFTILNSSLIFDVEKDADNGRAASVSGVLSSGSWQHVAVTFEAATKSVHFYCQGIEQTLSSNTISSIPDELSNDLYFGRWGGTYDSAYFDGMMDDIRIYTKVLSPTEITSVYNNQALPSEGSIVNSDVSYIAVGNEIEIAVPRSDIGQGSGSSQVAFDFHWADNIQKSGDIIEFGISGDSAPNRRFNYRYDTEISAKACQRLFDEGEGDAMDLDQDCNFDMDDLILFASDWISEYDLDGFAGIAQNWLDDYMPANLNGIVLVGDDFETGDLSQNSWQLSGNADWFASTNETYQGSYSAQSGDIDDGQYSQLNIDIVLTADSILSFKSRTSSESGYDKLYFYIDSDQKSVVSGSGPWTRSFYPLAAGSYTLSWKYEKDSSISRGHDAGFVDNIEVLVP